MTQPKHGTQELTKQRGNGMIDKARLYDLIDADDDLTDKEKREIYFAEIDEAEQMESEANGEFD